ncbi:MAG: undecaprenyl-diphosphate phosphatase [Deltaproteobacteria bacterium]|nr:undecaprenyl-diphosphate phosphatase [Deltaproteobacteria bacterium]
MTLIDAVILGIIQGLTEFLPISSSGHLVIFQNLLQTAGDLDFVFDTALHLGTLLSIIIFFMPKIRSLIKSFFKLIRLIFKRKLSEALKEPDIKILVLIIAASVPTAIIGLLLGGIIQSLLGSAKITGIMLIITGIILWLTKYAKNDKFGIEKFSFKKGFLIGIAQGFSVIPGISRSGSTISAGLFLGIKPEVCAEFSFLLSIPAILGAQIISFANFSCQAIPFKIIAAGVFAAFASGYIALILLMKTVKKGKFYYFAPYCWVIGILAFLKF